MLLLRIFRLRPQGGEKQATMKHSKPRFNHTRKSDFRNPLTHRERGRADVTLYAIGRVSSTVIVDPVQLPPPLQGEEESSSDDSGEQFFFKKPKSGPIVAIDSAAVPVRQWRPP